MPRQFIKDQTKELAPYLDFVVKPLIWWSVAWYIVEVSTGSADSRAGHAFFLWNERVVASIFILEYIIRWMRNDGWHLGKYPRSFLGIIDLLSFVPFLVGFVCPASWLGIVRALRIIRLLKYFRYSRGLQIIALGFYRAMPYLKALAFFSFIFFIMFTSMIYEAEKVAQPDDFGNIGQAAWYIMITITTVGFGDLSPATEIGKVVTALTLLILLTAVAGAIGIIGNALSKTVDEDIDPSVDPIAMFKKQREEQKKIRAGAKQHEERQRKAL